MSCSRCKHQNKSKTEMPCLECMQNRAVDHFKPMTNGDAIRNMTDEELAEFIANKTNNIVNCCNCDEPESDYGCCIGDCKNPWLKWLQAEVEGEE